jgi:hypothetical protein
MRTELFESLLDESTCEEDVTEASSVAREVSDLASANGLKLTESELQEFRIIATKRRVIRGAEKRQARLYRVRNKSALKLSHLRYKRTAGSKRLARMWKKLKSGAGAKLLQSLKKRFGKRTMVRLTQSLEQDDKAPLFTESSAAPKDESITQRAVAGVLTANTLAIMGMRFIEAKLGDHADQIAERAEAIMESVDKLLAGTMSQTDFDSQYVKDLDFWQKVVESHDADEFWDRYAEQSDLAKTIEQYGIEEAA